MWSVTFGTPQLICVRLRLPFLCLSQLHIEKYSRGQRFSRQDLVDGFVELSCFVILKRSTTFIAKQPQRKLLAPSFANHSIAFGMSSEVTDTNSHLEKISFINYISN